MHFKAVIIGGGPAGATAAICLARAGFNVLLIEKKVTFETSWGETSPPRLRSILVQLGCWDEFDSQNYPRIHGIISSWGNAESYFNDYIYQIPGYGWHVPRGPFDRWLQKLATDAGCRMECSRVVGFHRAGARWRIDVERLGEITADWLLNAAGRFQEKRLSNENLSTDRLVAITCTYVVPFHSMPERPLIESVPNGWWYSVGSPDGKIQVMYFTDADLIPKNYKSAQQWQNLLENTTYTNVRLKTLGLYESPKLRPVKTGCIKMSHEPRSISIGDAAMAMDPLSSQGICFALESAQCVTNEILDSPRNTSHRLPNYMNWYQLQVQQYKQNYYWFYSQERRWAKYPFWNRRQNKDRPQYA